MKVLQLNTQYPRGSTGRISMGIHDVCREENIECITAYRYEEATHYEDTMLASSWLDCHVHNRLAWITGLQGCFSFFRTLGFLKKVKKWQPDLIQLQNLHGSYLNWPLLFRYLKKSNIQVVWTLHDCLSMTGRCPYFTMSGCEKWKTGCHHCPVIHDFPSAWIDLTRFMWKKKKKWLTGVPKMQLVTPSVWLSKIVPESYMKEYPVRVIYNGIDLEVFKPTESDFREKHNIGDRKLLLFVASVWEKRKGLNAVLRFADLPQNEYCVCVVGTNDEIDAQLPSNVISIHRTDSARELAQIYTASDLFVNPTLEENYPTVNMEALACGTPVLTYATGGAAQIPDETCGMAIPSGEIEQLVESAKRILAENTFSREACLKRARGFDRQARFREYTKMYRELLGEDETKC